MGAHSLEGICRNHLQIIICEKGTGTWCNMERNVVEKHWSLWWTRCLQESWRDAGTKPLVNGANMLTTLHLFSIAKR